MSLTDVIHGLWIYEEKDRSRIATTMQRFVCIAQISLKRKPTLATLCLSMR